MKNFLLKTWLTMICLLFGVGTMWAEVKSGTTYSTLSSSNMPVGWSAADGGGTSYIKLIAASHYITTDEFSQAGITSITIKARTYGGPTSTQAKITASWVVGTSVQELGSVTPTSTSLTNYTIKNISTSIIGTGKIKFECKEASSSKGSGVSEITITYTSGASETYKVSVTGSTPGAGSISANPTSATAGSTITVTATPNNGYEFSSLSVKNGNTSIANNVNLVYTISEDGKKTGATFTMPSGDVQLYGNFEVATVSVPTPLIPSSANYLDGKKVFIGNYSDDYMYAYTIDGSDPAFDELEVTNGTLYNHTEGIDITSTCTLKVIAIDGDGNTSSIASATYEILVAYTVTIEEPTNGTLVVMYGTNELPNGGKVYVGNKITATATPAEGYKFRNIQFTDETTHTFTASNVKEWTMGEHDITISATFDPVEYYTISFSINGAVQSVVYEENATITAPTVEDINGKKFVGWVKSTVTVNPETAPSYETIGKATENVTYVAVFAEADGDEGAETWNKVTDASSLAAGDIITLVSSEKVDYNSPGTTTKVNGYVAISTQASNNWKGVGVTVENDVLYKTEDVQAFTLIATTSDDYPWAFCYDNKYLYAAGGTSSNYLKSTDKLENTASFSISIEDGAATIVANVTGEKARNTLWLNGNYNSGQKTFNPIFSCYQANSSYNKPSIYKKIGGATYSNFTTTPVPLAEASLTISSVGYATYYNAFAYTMPENVVGKIMKNEGDAIVSEEVFTEGDVVPAETALLLKGTAATYTLVENRTPATKSVEGNLLHGLLEDGTTTGGGEGAKYYKFANGGKGLGWYYGSSDNTDGHAFSIAANKAYLVIEADEAMSSVRFISVEGFEGTITEIESVNAVDQNAEIFDLQGRRVRNTQSGVYVINGKKVIR